MVRMGEERKEAGSRVWQQVHLTIRPLLTTPSCPLLLALSPQSDKMAKVSSTSENHAVAPAEKMLMFKSHEKLREEEGGRQFLNLILREMESFERKGNNPSPRPVDAPGRVNKNVMNC